MSEPLGAYWDGSLESLFAVLDEVYRRGVMPGRPNMAPSGVRTPEGTVPPGGAVAAAADRTVQPELFADADPRPARVSRGEEGRGGSPPEGRPFPPGEPFLRLFPNLRDSRSAALLLALSADAFDAFVLAWMSELPIEGEILRFGWKVLAAAGAAASPGDAASRAARPGARTEAERAASDRGDPDVRGVLGAAYKVNHEIERIKGFLRFSPGRGGLYLARCSPDYYVLPALVEHFTLRFGTQDWAVIDEKRGLALLRRSGGDARLVPAEPSGPREPAEDEWEELWRHYHKTINNEDRRNPALQRQFMPKRYRNYLPELR
ncbi:MAG: TIGR03915 family putative DNA repair protein [Treponema sp.]|jgi:probable DNA metabolism protein|nr:TIGR03915 family putative DNA repair protein [Treponema sp.]